MKEHAAGLYPLRRPHLPRSLKPEREFADGPSLPLLGGTVRKETEESDGVDKVAHEFTLRVCGVHGLEVESELVWGEADCYVQYHFPTISRNTDMCGTDPGECLSLRFSYPGECLSLRFSYPGECLSLRFSYPGECLSLRFSYIIYIISTLKSFNMARKKLYEVTKNQVPLAPPQSRKKEVAD